MLAQWLMEVVKDMVVLTVNLPSIPWPLLKMKRSKRLSWWRALMKTKLLNISEMLKHKLTETLNSKDWSWISIHWESC